MFPRSDSHFAAAWGGRVGAYGLVEAQAAAADDAAGSRATTAVVAVGGTSLGSLEVLRDRDWFAVDLVAGHRYSFSQNGISLVDPLLRLRSGNGGVLASNDDANPSTRDSLITYTATTTGRHFLDAGAWNDSLTGTYSVAATDLTPTPARDDFAAGTGTAGVVSVGGSRGGALGQNGDHDWFRVEVQAGHTYAFRADGVTLADPTLSLRDGIGLQLGFNDDASASSRNALISYTAPASSTLFLDVGAYANGGVGTYAVSATDLTPTAPPATTGFSSLDGYGEVNAARALERLLGSPIARQPALGGAVWNLDRLDAPSVWATGVTGAGVTVAVVDTGVDLGHSDLDGALWTNPREVAGNGIDDDGNGYIDDLHGWDFVDADADPSDLNGHGTFVAGTIAAENNGSGTTGVAHGATIMPVRVLDETGSGGFSTMVNGIRYATANGARVINLSLGGSMGSPDLQAAIRSAEAAGVLVVMAAGNSGRAAPGFPAAYAGQAGMAVGASDAVGTLAGFSNRAGAVAIDYVSAPGVNVVSTIPGEQTATWSGTSMATAHVAGVAALLLSARPGLTAGQVKTLQLASASHAGGAAAAVQPVSTAPVAALRAMQRGLSARMSAVSARISSRALLR